MSTPELPDDLEISIAEGLGAAAARAQQDRDACPYPRGGTPQERVLARRWLLGWAGEPGGPMQRALFGTRLQTAKRRARRVARRLWYGAGDATGRAGS
jgi:hypothetical protein